MYIERIHIYVYVQSHMKVYIHQLKLYKKQYK